MSISPEQMRKKSLAMAESQRHVRYSEVNKERSESQQAPGMSPAITAAGKRVDAATAKENADIGGRNASINDNRY